MVAGGHLVPLLGVFQKLIASKAHDHEGFDVLNALVESLPLAAYEQYLPTVCTLLFRWGGEGRGRGGNVQGGRAGYPHFFQTSRPPHLLTPPLPLLPLLPSLFSPTPDPEICARLRLLPRALHSQGRAGGGGGHHGPGAARHLRDAAATGVGRVWKCGGVV